MFEKLHNKMAQESILIKLALVNHWAIIEKVGIGYRLKNGNYGIRFKDHTQLFVF
jgi:hypothetical protein